MSTSGACRRGRLTDPCRFLSVETFEKISDYLITDEELCGKLVTLSDASFTMDMANELIPFSDLRSVISSSVAWCAWRIQSIFVTASSSMYALVHCLWGCM